MGKISQFAGGIRTWFQGKKTILGGCVLMAAGVAGVALGKVSVVDGVTLVGFGISISGFGAKADRHQSQMLTALQAVATAGVDLRLGHKAAALAAVEPVLVTEVAAAVNIAQPSQASSEPLGGKN